LGSHPSGISIKGEQLGHAIALEELHQRIKGRLGAEVVSHLSLE
jgi:hypothetical protein